MIVLGLPSIDLVEFPPVANKKSPLIKTRQNNN